MKTIEDIKKEYENCMGDSFIAVLKIADFNNNTFTYCFNIVKFKNGIYSINNEKITEEEIKFDNIMKIINSQKILDVNFMKYDKIKLINKAVEICIKNNIGFSDNFMRLFMYENKYYYGHFQDKEIYYIRKIKDYLELDNAYLFVSLQLPSRSFSSERTNFWRQNNSTPIINVNKTDYKFKEVLK